MSQGTRDTLAGLLTALVFFGGWICTFLFIVHVYEDDERTSYHSGARPDSPAWEEVEL